MPSMQTWVNNEGFQEEVGLERGLEGCVDRIKEGGQPRRRAEKSRCVVG